MRGVVYARVSTYRQADGVSLGEQERECCRRAEPHPAGVHPPPPDFDPPPGPRGPARVHSAEPRPPPPTPSTAPMRRR